jgi:2-polyprenyl-3-methyl-5-hydroxy-6-metoxy-1,4-benzoquinol methylase/uncharacterized protein YbaR (Trm112 family)
MLSDDLLSILICPRDQTPLWRSGDFLVCKIDHKYPVVDGVPVFLCPEQPQTIRLAYASIRAAETGIGAPLYVDTLGGISLESKQRIEREAQERQSTIDPVISWMVATTSGRAYSSLIGKLSSYPIPEIPFAPTQERHRLLDVGCSWGRWSVSAAQKGWHVVGIDPSLGALMAARRLAATKRLDIGFICGDVRFMPFKAEAFQALFSYSVLQHFDDPDLHAALTEIARVMAKGGVSKVQMAHRGGIMSTYHRTRSDHINAGRFSVRYLSWQRLQDAFEKAIGPTTLRAEAFGGLGLLYSDRNIVSPWARFVITISEAMKRAARILPPLRYISDSVLVESHKAMS